MSKQIINPPDLFPSLPHGFSQVVIASGAKTVFISGQTAWDANKALVGGADLAGQLKQALRNLKMAVESAGGSLTDVVSLRIYIVEGAMRDLAAVGAALEERFPVDPPASTWH